MVSTRWSPFRPHETTQPLPFLFPPPNNKQACLTRPSLSGAAFSAAAAAAAAAAIDADNDNDNDKVDHRGEGPYIHPGPSDEQLSASMAGVDSDGDDDDDDDDASLLAAAVSSSAAEAAAAAATSSSRAAQEEQDLRKAIARSLVDSAQGAAAAAAVPTIPTAPACNPKQEPEPEERQEQKHEVTPIPSESDFFWVEAEWLRQWVVGQHDGSPSDRAPAAAAAAAAARGGSSSGDPVVLDGSPAPKGRNGDGGVDRIALEKTTLEMDVDEEAKAAAAAAAGEAGGGDEDMAGGGSGERPDGGIKVDVVGGKQGAGVAAPAAAATEAAAGPSSKGTPEPVEDRHEKPRRSDEEELVAEEAEAEKDRSRSRSRSRNGVTENGVVSSETAVAASSNGVKSAVAGSSQLDEAAAQTGAAAELVVTTPSGGGTAEGGAAPAQTPPVSMPTPAKMPVPKGVFAQPMRIRPLLCPHGRVHPASVSRLKLVTRAVYEGLLGGGKGGVGVAADHHIAAGSYYCALCVKEHVRKQ